MILNLFACMAFFQFFDNVFDRSPAQRQIFCIGLFDSFFEFRIILDEIIRQVVFIDMMKHGGRFAVGRFVFNNSHFIH